MTEPTPPARSNTMIVVLLLLVCAALVYLDWRKSGEIENLHARIDGLAPPQPMRTAAPAAPSRVPPDFARAMDSQPPDPSAPAPIVPPDVIGTTPEEYVPGSLPTLPQQPAPVGPSEPHPLIRAVLQAHTDGELHTMGNEGT